MPTRIQLDSKKHSHWRYSACAALIASALAGCGGGGSGGGSPATLTGTVIDGYISGATVCLDLNNNQSCDAGEPNAKSGDKGSYSLDVTGITIDALKTSHLLTVVPEEAKDSDDGGKTLKEVEKAPFSLLAPVAAYVGADNSLSKAVISPLTTLVSHDMIVNNNTFSIAQVTVRSRLELGSNVDLTQDFVAADRNGSLHKQAQVIAAALGQAQKTVAENGAKPREAFVAAMAYAQTYAKRLNESLTSGSGSVAEKTKFQIANAYRPEVARLLTAGQAFINSASASSPASVTAVLGEGVYLADLLQENPPQYTKASIADGKITVTGFERNGNQWMARTEDGDPEYVLTSTGWKEDNGCVNGPIKDTGLAKADLTCIDGSNATVSVRTLDVTNKSLADLGQSAPDSFKDFKFPEGSKVHLTVFSNLTDEYQIWGESPVTGPDNAPLFNIANFMNAYATGSTGIRFYPDRDSAFSFTFDLSGTGAKSGNVTLWRSCSTAGIQPCFTPLGKATYEIKTVHGQDVLIVRVKPKEEAPGNFFLFGVRGGNLYSGVYRPAFTGSVTDGFLNKTAMNAVLKKAGLPEIN